MDSTSCYHCGLECNPTHIEFDDKSFCCKGCKTVYEIFTANDLGCYYDFEANPGATPIEINGKYDFLENAEICNKLLEFSNDGYSVITLSIPHIHCSSCIWILENLNRLNPGIRSAMVNFNEKTVRIGFRDEQIGLKDLVELLCHIGYEPYISLDSIDAPKKRIDRSLYYKLGIAGFAFGNIMFLSFPEYFQVSGFWIEQYKHVFRWIMFAFSLPVVFYAASDYFQSAYKGLRSMILNIDVPIALGITVLFLRSTVEILFDLGSGFFDSLTGLVFFLLVGKYFQQKTYAFLSFERDYKSYFPIAVTAIDANGDEYNKAVYEIETGDRLLIRNGELIPTDCILMSASANVDYSFVTGESDPVKKASGDKLFAGGKQMDAPIEVEVLHSVKQSYLTQLWSHDAFLKDRDGHFRTLTNRISKHFTIIVLLIAAISGTYWWFNDPSKMLNVITAVLIIACPCAIALSAPFTFGNLLRIFGRHKFYLKNANVLERLAGINTIIFDKTGTITTNQKTDVQYHGMPFSGDQHMLFKSTLRGSNHPLSRKLYELLDQHQIVTLDAFEEIPGQGIKARLGSDEIRIGSQTFVDVAADDRCSDLETAVHVAIGKQYLGKYTFHNAYRQGIAKLFNALKPIYDLVILTGDNTGEKQNLKKLLPPKTKLLFNQKPEEKLEYIRYHQTEGSAILMIGDGLNDAGALAQSDVGVAVADNINVFTPACDAILDAAMLPKLDWFMNASKKGIAIVKWSFVFSFVYNVIGLYFAVTGQLMPVIAAILMPLSSISIVAFTTLATNILGKRINHHKT